MKDRKPLKRFSIPKMATLTKLALYLETSVNYLVDEEEMVSTNEDKYIIKQLLSSQQRYFSLRSGDISENDIIEIGKYTSCDLFYLLNMDIVEFQPNLDNFNISNSVNMEVLIKIIDISDRLADSDKLKTIQIQLSRIAIYWLAKKNISQEMLCNDYKLSRGKVKYICTGVANKDPLLNFGFNFSDYMKICEISELPIWYLFTGVEESPIEMLKKENEELRNSH